MRRRQRLLYLVRLGVLDPRARLAGKDHHDGNACDYCTLLAHSPVLSGHVHLVLPTKLAQPQQRPLLYAYFRPRPYRWQATPLDPPA